ncbi:MAG: class I SAM-dependent methyltransferase [Candidatus Falkowbacteria bacterium]|nr:class I SAM-dependent methyltransferase [Candidatus Falkowbacteria bacterium]
MLQLKTNKPLIDIEFILKKVGIQENDKVAELGCGSFGYFVYPLARLVGKNGRVYAVDILKSSLEGIKRKAIQENLRQIETIWSNLEIFKATKIEGAVLDVVFLINILNQSDKKAEIIREAVRLLKRNAKLVIIEWKSGQLPFGPTPEKRLKIDSIKSASLQLGLTLSEEFTAGEYHYGLIFKKI